MAVRAPSVRASSPSSRRRSRAPHAQITICLRASRNRRSSVGDQVIKLSEFYEAEDPEHLFGESKCPLTHYVPFTFNALSRIT
uniref:Uncharacterized protein n=1 Tax=Zea mays TaxID=4577 RepID=C0PCQ8_MAIZE|nr:unknown [Zea mays]